MKKKRGMSSTLGTVFMVWITISAAVGVYYWAEGLTTRPKTATKSTRAFTIESCDLNNETSRIEVRNTGSLSINASAKLFDEEKNHVGYVDFSTAINGSLYPGEADFIDIKNTTIKPKQTYLIIEKGLPKVKFMCH